MSYASPRFEEVEAGQELAPVVKTPNEVQVFMFSAITWDTHRTHFDTPYSVDEESLPGVLVHGHLQGAFLTQYATRWAGAAGRLRSIDYQNRGMVIPGERLTVRAKVTGKSQEDGVGVVTLDMWLEKDGGDIPTTGAVVVEIPLG